MVTGWHVARVARVDRRACRSRGRPRRRVGPAAHGHRGDPGRVGRDPQRWRVLLGVGTRARVRGCRRASPRGRCRGWWRSCAVIRGTGSRSGGRSRGWCRRVRARDRLDLRRLRGAARRLGRAAARLARVVRLGPRVGARRTAARVARVGSARHAVGFVADRRRVGRPHDRECRDAANGRGRRGNRGGSTPVLVPRRARVRL